MISCWPFAVLHKHLQKSMGGAELQMSRIRAGVFKYKFYIATTSWSTKCIFLKVVKFKYL